VAEYRHGQRGQHAGDGGNQQSAKHCADVGVRMKTLHESRVNGVDVLL